MIIRAAQDKDSDEIIELGLRMHKESAYAFLPFECEKLRRLIASYLSDFESQCGLVAEENDVIVGMLGGYLTDYFFCNEKMACDMILYVVQEYRGSSAAARLIRAFRLWAVEHGAREMCLGISSNINTERTGRFYERMGFTHCGGVYKQRLGEIASEKLNAKDS
jgi:GNAT superfamily N-acetyltransferase